MKNHQKIINLIPKVEEILAPHFTDTENQLIQQTLEEIKRTLLNEIQKETELNNTQTNL